MTTLAMKDDSFTPAMKWKIHEPIYRWMSQYVDASSVVDVGCGDCLGIPHLGGRARHVIAVDSNVDVLRSAECRLGNVALVACDCAHIPLRDASVDVVVSNALLEYLSAPGAFVDEVRRILKPRGQFLCGTKNVDLSIKKRGEKLIYRNHVTEYSPSSLSDLLGRVFGSVNLYGLRLSERAEQFYMDAGARSLERAMVGIGIKSWLPRRLRRAARRVVTGVGVEDLTSCDFPIERIGDDAYYLIARCS